MVRTPLTPEERLRGERLGALLREARGARSMVAVAASAGLSAETLRKIETGRAPTPAFFTVAALAAALGLSLDEILTGCAREPDTVDGMVAGTMPPAVLSAVPAGALVPLRV
ncbi:helix-turn-helix domain-containing protein [Streptomyces sp. NBC_00101]|uniref:helix-turn-helix domain-containing protein n=1 Tax=Streptomyces sp. NBC_00101 TaxID=2975651 RepID=UPI003245D447